MRHFAEMLLVGAIFILAPITVALLHMAIRAICGALGLHLSEGMIRTLTEGLALGVAIWASYVMIKEAQ